MLMLLMVLKAYAALILFDAYLARCNFGVLYDRVRLCPLGDQPPEPEAVGRICAAVDTACIWYRKEVLCLQRSAATACLLKKHGVKAQLVIGAQQKSFKAHAWVEVGGRVVNDKPYMPEVYGILDRC
jgi:Transglutaminase-like superfamily